MCIRHFHTKQSYEIYSKEFYFFFAVPCFCDTSGDLVTSIFMFLTEPEGERDGDLATSILMLLTDPEGDRDFLCDISSV